MKENEVKSDFGGAEDEKKKKRKRRKITISKLMTPIVMTLFILVALMVLNYPSFCHFCNKGSYVEVTSTVARETTDSLAMVIPMVELQYHYQGTDYDETKLFVLEPLFGLSSKEGSKLTLYVNKNAPGYCLIKTNFWSSIVNIILFLFGLAFIFIWCQRVVKGILNVRDRRRERKTEEEEGEEENEEDSRETVIPEDAEFLEDMELYRLLEEGDEED